MTATDAPALGCVVLAAGGARRFGGPKLLTDVGGQTLLGRAVEAARGAGCARVAVVLGADGRQLWRALDDALVERIDNPRWDEGMASSIRAAVTWARNHDLSALVLVAADQPHLDAGHLATLIAASADGRRIAASQYAGVLGIPAVFPSRWFPVLNVLRGDVGARDILRRSSVPVTAVPWPAGAFDVDRRADVPAAQTLISPQ
jgi:CTP:molybdopterin cytidylyltransferase MocA